MPPAAPPAPTPGATDKPSSAPPRPTLAPAPTAGAASKPPQRRPVSLAADEPDRPAWLTPVLVLLVAFCVGVQAAFFLQIFRGVGYFSTQILLKFTTLALMLAGIYMLLPGERQEELKTRFAYWWSRTKGAAGDVRSRMPKRVEAPASKPAAKPLLHSGVVRSTSTGPVHLNLESPLARGPVWPPGEPIPITIQIRVEGGTHDDVDVEIDLIHAGGKETVRVPLRGSAAVLSQTVPVPGPFTITARALRAGSAVAESTLQGRAAQYREEIGRRFDELKAAAASAGLAVGADSTPREVRDALARRFPRLRASLDELVAAIEVALYSQEEVSRETYESLVRALTELSKLGLEAPARA